MSYGQPEASSGTRWTVGLTMAAFAAASAVISYTDGLFLVRLAGATGRVAYLYPLLPDGLILISLAALYDAARARAGRPGWATGGVVLGVMLTVAMNVAAGWSHSGMDALVDGSVPVVFFVAVEILNGLVRRGRGGDVSRPVPAAPGQPPPLTLDDAIRAAAGHLTKRQIAEALECSRQRVDKVLPPVPRAAAVSVNGDGPHE